MLVTSCRRKFVCENERKRSSNNYKFARRLQAERNAVSPQAYREPSPLSMGKGGVLVRNDNDETPHETTHAKPCFARGPILRGDESEMQHAVIDSVAHRLCLKFPGRL